MTSLLTAKASYMPSLDKKNIAAAIVAKHEEYLVRTLTSIKANGLCPLSMLGGKAVTSITQVQETQGKICVNAINLAGTNEMTLKRILKIAVEEEFCGIRGICLERQWSFQSKEKSQYYEEIAARLLNSLVFLLKPPTISSVLTQDITYDLDQIDIPRGTTVSLYQAVDGISGNRAKARLLDSSTPAFVGHQGILEIKTSRSFSMENVLSVLVPEPLVNLVRMYLPNLDIIPVPLIEKTLFRLPQMLLIMHEEMLREKITVNAPDYERALTDWQARTGSMHFSIHCVRMATPFDFDIRPVLSSHQSEALLQRLHGTVIDNQGSCTWGLFHRKYTFNLKASLDAAIRRASAGYIYSMQQMVTCCARLMAEQEELRDAKGNFQIKLISNAVLEQLDLLQANGVKIIPHPLLSNKYYITFPSQKEAQVNRIVMSYHSAVSILRATGIGFMVRKDLSNLQQSTQKVLGLKRALAEAEAELAKAEQRLDCC